MKTEVEVKNPTPKEGPFDITHRVKVTFNGPKKSPFHKEGATTMVSQAVADSFKAKGFVK